MAQSGTRTEALADLGTKTSEAQMHAWFAGPAHDELVKADRWAARRKQAASAFLEQLTSTGAAVPSSLRQASLVYVDRLKLHLSPFALGIPSMGLWS